jgi:hypothetical protein
MNLAAVRAAAPESARPALFLVAEASPPVKPEAATLSPATAEALASPAQPETAALRCAGIRIGRAGQARRDPAPAA